MAKALIFAGGSGLRMNTKSKPKQFLTLHGKPVIIYTLEHFEENAQIDEVVVVCIEAWIDKLWGMIAKHGIKKVKAIVPGGSSAFESIFIGLTELMKTSSDDDIVLIHDGVRPLITERLIDENIAITKERGNAITADYARETIVEMQEGNEVKEVFEREALRVVKAPQTFKFGEIYKEVESAIHSGENYIDMCSLMRAKGYTMNTVQSCDYNIKITTAADFYIFRAILDALDNSQIFGLDI